jgi:hypothetical protein
MMKARNFCPPLQDDRGREPIVPTWASREREFEREMTVEDIIF